MSSADLDRSAWPASFDMAWIVRHGLHSSTWPGSFDMAWIVRHGLDRSTWPGSFDMAWIVRHGLDRSTWCVGRQHLTTRGPLRGASTRGDRKSTRLNSSHEWISY